ncbi:MAG TPA: A24 family peptidase [Polyangiaceae bacterium]|nr:A24 family peptidase [Polyangiaceae bacterium]
MTPFDIAALALTATAAGYDLRTGHIPNWLTFGSLLGAIFARALLGALHGGPALLGHAVFDAVCGVLVCGAVPAIVFFRGGMGGGDVKLFSALGALCSARAGLLAESYSFVIALLLAPVSLAYQGKLLRTLLNTAALATNAFRHPEARRATPPELLTWFRLAPAIFLGTSVMLVLSR